MGLLDWLFHRGGGGRDGSTPEKAIPVGSVADEYQWMRRHCPGFAPVRQVLQQVNGRSFDVLTWQNEGGEARTVYFDISKFFGR